MAWLLPAGMGAGLVAASVAGFFVGIQRAASIDHPIAVPSTIAVLVDDDFSFDFDEEV